MLWLYNTATLPLRLGVEIWAAWAAREEPRRREWAERRARRLPVVPAGGVWVHGASVGEVQIVRGLATQIRARRPDLPLAVSATTTSGRARLPEPPAVDGSFFVPLDFPGLASRLLGALRPRVVVLVETELWPNLLHESFSSDVPVAILNGRLSPGRMSRYRRLSRLYRPLLERIAVLGAQSAEDAERWRELGVPPGSVVVTGNIKYDLRSPTTDAGALRRELGLPADRPVLVAGSTAPGEEVQMLEAFRSLRRECPDLLLVLAPRHVKRSDEVADLVASHGLSYRRRSTGEPVTEADVLLLDTVGELVAFYALARVAFVGGSLVPGGGHNLLEPAALAVPVLFGPHTDHVREPARALVEAGGGCRVRDGAELGRSVALLLREDDRRSEMARRARALVEANRGALERSVALLLETLDARGAPSIAGSS